METLNDSGLNSLSLWESASFDFASLRSGRTGIGRSRKGMPLIHGSFSGRQQTSRQAPRTPTLVIPGLTAVRGR